MWHQMGTASISTNGNDYKHAGYSSHSAFTVAERRAKPRLKGTFPALVHGVDARGETFDVYTTLDDISAGGLYLRLDQRLEPGTTLFIVATLSSAAKSIDELAPRVALHGVVLRSELKQDGECGIAIAFSHHRFL